MVGGLYTKHLQQAGLADAEFCVGWDVVDSKYQV